MDTGLPNALGDIDPTEPGLWRSGRIGEVFARLRAEDPVHYCGQSAFGPFWSITRYDDVVHVEGRPDLFSSSHLHGGITVFGKRRSWFPMFIAMDPPDHGDQRQAVAPAFAPSVLRGLQPVLLENIDALIARLPVVETFDWGERVSKPLAADMLGLLLALPPEDTRNLPQWAAAAADLEAIADPAGARQRLETLWGSAGTFLTLWKHRSAEGAEDLISLMSRSPATRGFSPQEIVGTMMLVVVGGYDTTHNAMNALPVVNHAWPGEWEALEGGAEDFATFAQELIRWQTPLAHMRRTATEASEIGGKLIRPGDKVVLWYLSANRDESVFADPDRFIGDRANARQHLAFGHGIHRCVGARLAELQLTSLVAALRSRKLRPVLDGDAIRSGNCFSNGYSQVPARLIREA